MIEMESIELTAVQGDELFHDIVDLISRHGCISPSKLYKEEDGWAAELTASSARYPDIEIVAQIYVSGKRLKEIQEGE